MFRLSKRLVESSRPLFRNGLKSFCDLPAKVPTPQQSKPVVTDKLYTKDVRELAGNKYEDNDDDDGTIDGFLPDYDYRYVSQFEKVPNKDRDSFLEMIRVYEARDKQRRHDVDFIYVALKEMKEFGVERDVEVYKKILDVMPKGKYEATNTLLVEYMYYPKHQNCIIFLLHQMEVNRILPDLELHTILTKIFGPRSRPMYKLWRMMYWLPKFKYLSPWLLPDPVPDDTFALAQLAVKQMCSIDVQSVVDAYDTSKVENANDKTWVVSGQSPDQKKLLRRHPVGNAIRIEGPHTIWLRSRTINYFILMGDVEPDESFQQRTDPDDVRDIPIPEYLGYTEQSEVAKGKPKRSMHQQDDGTIYAICATGTSSKDSLLSWIRLLELHGNPTIGSMPVLFKFRSSTEENPLEIEANKQ